MLLDYLISTAGTTHERSHTRRRRRRRRRLYQSLVLNFSLPTTLAKRRHNGGQRIGSETKLGSWDRGRNRLERVEQMERQREFRREVEVEEDVEDEDEEVGGWWKNRNRW